MSSVVHPYDIIMLVVLVGATVFGALKGVAWQIASLASLIVSYFVALRFSGDLAYYFGWNEPWNRFLAMLIVYLTTSFAIWMLFRLVAGFIDRLKLKEFDHQVGALVGLAKGVLLCVCITFFVVTLSERGREPVLRSRSGYYIAVVLERSKPIMPPEVAGMLRPYIDRLQNELEPARQGTAPPAATDTSSDTPFNSEFDLQFDDQGGAVEQRPPNLFDAVTPWVEHAANEASERLSR